MDRSQELTSTLLADESPLGGLAAAQAERTMGKKDEWQYTGEIDPSRARNEGEMKLLTNTKRIFDNLKQRGGVEIASILNMHPWEIRATGPHNEGIVIPACPIGQPYFQFVQRDIRIDRADNYGTFIPTEVWPIMIMRDFVKQHEEWGGLVAYMGDVRPGQANTRGASNRYILQGMIAKETDPEKKKSLQMLLRDQPTASDTRFATEDEVVRMIANAREKQLEYYERRYEKCEQAHAANAANAWKSIMPTDRLIARWLVADGRYAKLPQWVTEKRPKDYVQKSCAKCGADVDPKGFACAKCSYIHDGIKAYKAGEVDATHFSLKRHTREELDGAGLENILTLDEERKKSSTNDKPKKAVVSKAATGE